MSLQQKAIKGFIWSAIEKWGIQAISFIIFLILARLLEPKAFGLVAQASIFITFIELFVDQGFTKAIVQRHEIEPEHLDTAFWTNISMSLIMTGISILGSGLVAKFFGQPEIASIVRWLSLSFIIGAFNSVQASILTRQLDFKGLSIRSLIAASAGGVVALTMAFMGFGVWSIVSNQLVNRLVGAIVLWQVGNWRPGLNFSKKHFQELFAFGINMLGIKVLMFFNRRADDLLIGYFLGSVALGYYTVAYKLLQTMISVLIGITQKVAMPTFSRLQKEPEELRRFFYSLTKFTTAIAFPVFLGMFVLAPELITTLFGEKWEASVPVMQILTFNGILQAAQSYNGALLMALGKPSWSLRLNCLDAVTNVTAFAIVVQWGILAVASAFVIRSYLFSPIRLWSISKLVQINIKEYLSLYISPILSSLIMLIVILITKNFLQIWLTMPALIIVNILLGSLIYFASIRLLDPQLFYKLIKIVSSILSSVKFKKT